MRYKLLSEVFEEYIRKNQRLKWATKDGRRRAWGKLIKAKGDMNVRDFTYDDAEDFQEFLFGQGLAPGAVRSYIKKVKSVFNWAWFKGYRQGDPFSGLKLPKVPQTEIRVYSNAELIAMLATASLLWQARIIAAASAGLRKSEVLNLTVKDIDFERGLILVQAKKETDHTWPWSPKNYEVRRLPLTEELNRLLVRILDGLPTGQPYLMLTAKRYWWLQQLRANGEMKERCRNTPDENFRPFKRILQRAKIGDGCFHDLRRTAITSWFLPESGLSPKEVQRLAGHSDIETTLKYYAACRTDIVDRARQAWAIGATGLEPATS